jgi:hypothetical protein
MPIYKLTRIDELGYDENKAMIIRAKTAKEIANLNRAGENDIWENTKLVKCFKINESGPSKVILISFMNG